MKLKKSPHDVEHRTAYRFAMLSTLSTRTIANLLRRHGLTDLGWRVLSLIGHNEPVTPGAIAKKATFDPDKVTRAVDRLVGSGLVVRKEDSADRRRVILTLTSRGQKVYAELEQVRRDMERDFLSVLSPDELRVFHAALDKLEEKARLLYQETRSTRDAAE
jgi:DNA-binding MarR family transcriptional regulator